ncbi:hypothetical protein [Parahaliea mediterranea]
MRQNSAYGEMVGRAVRSANRGLEYAFCCSC